MAEARPRETESGTGVLAPRGHYRPLLRRPSDPALRDLLPLEFAREHHVAPLARDDGRIIVAVTGEADGDVTRTLRRLTGRAIETVVSSACEIDVALDLLESGRSSYFETIPEQFLRQAGLLTENDLTAAWRRAVRRRISLVDALIAGGRLSEDDLLEVRALQLGLPHVRLGRWPRGDALTWLLPPRLRERHRLVPLTIVGDDLLLAVDHLPSRDAIQAVTEATGYSVRLTLATSSAVSSALAENAEPDFGPGDRPRRFFDHLRRLGRVPDHALDAAWALHEGAGEPFPAAIARLGRLDASWVRAEHAAMLRVPVAKLAPADIRPEAAWLIKEPLARRLEVLPLEVADTQATIAAVNPANADLRRLLSRITGLPVVLELADADQLEHAYAAVYGRGARPIETTVDPLAAYLVQGNYLPQSIVVEVLHQTTQSGTPFGTAIGQQPELADVDLTEAQALLHGLPWVALDRWPVQRAATETLPEAEARRLQAAPLNLDGRILTVVRTDPADRSTIRSLEGVSGASVRVALGSEPAVRARLATAYRVAGQAVTPRLRAFGAQLANQGLLTASDFDAALVAASESGRTPDVVLDERAILTMAQWADALADFVGLERVALAHAAEREVVVDVLGRSAERVRWADPVDRGVAPLIDLADAERLRALPFRRSDRGVDVAVADPLPADLAEQIRPLIGSAVTLWVATSAELDDAIARSLGQRRLGDMVLEAGLVSGDDLARAVRLATDAGTRIGPALIALGAITEGELASFLAEQVGLPYFDLGGQSVDPDLVRRLPQAFARERGVVPLLDDGVTITLGMTDPTDEEAAQEAGAALERRIASVTIAESQHNRVLVSVFREDYMETSAHELMNRFPDDSASRVLSYPQKLVLGGFVLVSVLWLVLQAQSYLTTIVALSTVFYLTFSGYKFYLTYTALQHDLEVPVSDEEVAALNDRDLPIYTLLVPLYKEAEVIPRLVRAIDQLDYPKLKLDVKLLLEEDDEETVQVVHKANLPAHFKPVIVPNFPPRGKPKACNYGLIQAEGEYVVIFDAEDVPEPAQLKKVLVVFGKVDPSVVVVQAKLNYYNRDQNLLTRWFTTEYSTWFDLFLPGLDATHAPIPLGGTSNHFPTRVLRQVAAWDPHNVTEDADLGMRIYKAGGRTAVVDSTTYEEANSALYNWIRQRSRWVKGYIQTWLVHMRHPVELYRAVGFQAFFSFNMVIGGTFFGFLINPLYWTLTGLWFLTQWEFIRALFPAPIFYVASVGLYAGNFAFAYLNVAGCMRRGYYELVKYALLSPVYWALMSVAAWKGFLQLFYAPSYWEKTVHGLYKGTVQIGDVD